MVLRMRKILIIYIGICSILLFSCKAHSSGAKTSQTEQNQRAKERESQRQYNKAYKRHLNMQDSATKKRMKKQLKAKKRAYKAERPGKSDIPCPKYEK